MAFDFVDLGTAINTALTTDLSTYARGPWFGQAPAGTGIDPAALPIVVWAFPQDGITDLSTFTSDGADILFDVRIVDHADNGMIPILTVLGRLIGNASAPGAATSGLHRRKLTMATNEASTIAFVGGGELFQGESDAKGMYLRFKVLYERA